jgi:hypothetical protein
MQMNLARYPNTNAGAQKALVAENQFGRQQIVAQ